MPGGGSAAADGPLRRLVEAESHRAGIHVEPDPERLAAGWELRFVSDAPRVDAAVELYRELGFEVCADPIAPSALAPGCAECRLVALLQFRAIYTRRRL